MVTKLDLIIYMVNFSSNQHRKRALTNIVFTESKTFGSSNRYSNYNQFINSINSLIQRLMNHRKFMSLVLKVFLGGVFGFVDIESELI